jgi:FKBP-type peptidyl-prolyl cis-trans isomerase
MFLLKMIGCSLLLATSRALCSAKVVKSLKNVGRFLSMSGGSAPDNEELKPFYVLGANIAKQVGGELKGILSTQEIEFLLKGFGDSMNNLISNEEERNLFSAYGPKLNEIIGSRTDRVLNTEKKKGEDFIVKYLLNHPRAIRTQSGLIFDEIIAGIGAQPTAASTVNVHYHGTLSDGTVFDSSVERGEPIKFPLKNVIQGWQEGVSMMRVGGKATLVVPSNLAYGDSGSPPVIPPGATLVFDVELLNVM